MAETISWVATGATIIAALMTAANAGARITGYGFVVFTFGAICWIAVGALTQQPALMWTNIALLIVDIFGVWRWLGRQSKVEEGAHAAAQASEAEPTETLFPVSLLTSAVVRRAGEEVGHCVDAMAGCRSGRIGYVVISEGGVAGVGETLRRLPWSGASVEDDALLLAPTVNPSALEELPRDQWPAR